MEEAQISLRESMHESSSGPVGSPHAWKASRSPSCRPSSPLRAGDREAPIRPSKGAVSSPHHLAFFATTFARCATQHRAAHRSAVPERPWAVKRLATSEVPAGATNRTTTRITSGTDSRRGGRQPRLRWSRRSVQAGHDAAAETIGMSPRVSTRHGAPTSGPGTTVQ